MVAGTDLIYRFSQGLKWSSWFHYNNNNTKCGLPFTFASKNPHYRLPKILRWYACGTDRQLGGQAGGWCTVTWLPNFLGWVVYHVFLPMMLRCTCFTSKSFAMKNVKDPIRTRGLHEQKYLHYWSKFKLCSLIQFPNAKIEEIFMSMSLVYLQKF